MSADLSQLSGRRCCVVGSPIAHSLSPALHQAAYGVLGLDWHYDAVELPAGDLRAFVAGLDDSWRGVSVTMPLKREAFELADEVGDGFAERLGVANTLVVADGRRSVRCYNTDVDGVRGALLGSGVAVVDAVTVVGGGATVAAVLAAVSGMGALRASLVVREPDRATSAVSIGQAYGLDVTVIRLDEVQALPAAPLLVSTIPAAAQAPYADVLAARAEVVFDVVYDPPSTPLIEAAGRAGKQTIGGLEMLLHQAARQLELMTGCTTVPLEAMRAAGLAALGNR